MDKTCNRCNTVKDIEAFSKNHRMPDGRLKKCRACESIDNKLYYEKNKERLKANSRKAHWANRDVILEQLKQRYHENKEVYSAKAKEWREANADYCKQKAHEYYVSHKEQFAEYGVKKRAEPGYYEKHVPYCREWSKGAGRDSVRETLAKHRRKYPQKTRARKAVLRACESGQLIRPSNCSQCGVEGNIEAHHHKGYEEQYKLDVQWLCKKCHRAADKQLKANEESKIQCL